MLALLALTGCGFQPVHGGNESQWLAHLRAARLEVPQSAIGWQLARALRTHQGGAAASGDHDLLVDLSLGRDDLLVQRDSDVIRSVVRLEGKYTLLDASGEKMLTGKLLVSAAYNRAGGGFASEVALRNAKERAARELAAQIWRRLILADDTRAAPGANAESGESSEGNEQ